MWHRYINTLMAAFVSILSGCASAPQEHINTFYPEVTSSKTATAGRITDIDGEFQAALQMMKSGNWHGAADKLAAITTSEPGLSGAWTNLGIARNKIGDTAGAEDAFNKAIAANPNQVVAYNELGIIYRRSGRLEEAAASYNSGLNISPNDEDIHWNLGILYDLYLPNPVQALTHYERYQQLTQSEDKQLLAWISELREQTSQVNVATGAKR